MQLRAVQIRSEFDEAFDESSNSILIIKEFDEIHYICTFMQKGA